MKSLLLVYALLVFGVSTSSADCTTSYLLSGTSPSSVLTIETINNLLTEHNRARREVSPWATVMPMVEWDQTLASHAQAYMDTCPHGTSLAHSSNSARSNVGGFSYVGENLAAGSGSSYLPPSGGTVATKAWNDEVTDYTYGKIGNSSTCAAGKACGHYTQNVWASTTKIGCGYTRCDSLPFKNYWGCVYGSGGNYNGQYPYVSTTDVTKVATCQITGVTPAPGTPVPPTPQPAGGVTPSPATPSPGTPAPGTAVPPTPQPASGATAAPPTPAPVGPPTPNPSTAGSTPAPPTPAPGSGSTGGSLTGSGSQVNTAVVLNAAAGVSAVSTVSVVAIFTVALLVLLF